MLLSCPAKKVTKECGIGEALRLGAHLRAKSRLRRLRSETRLRAQPRAEPPSPMYPTRRALTMPLEHLNGQNLLHSA